ncbi:THO complex subunit, partial [Phytophthora palmivora]
FTELNVVLAAFEGNAFSPDDLERSRDLSGGPIQSADVSMHELDSDRSKGAAEQGSHEHFFQPKYLTNSRLFRLQLRDPILRECMLTQFLILFNDLARAKPPVGSSTPKTKFADLTERVVALLKQTPSDGEGFNEMVTYVLERERNWVKWKQDKCPEYEKYPTASEKESSAAPKPVKRARRQLTSPLLEQILSESSKPSQILENIKGKERATEVSLTAYTDRFKEAWDPENGIEEEYWPDKDEMVCWRTMRAAMKASVSHLNLAVNGTGALVKGILGIDSNDVSKDATDTSVATPKSGDTVNDDVKKEQGEGVESNRQVPKDGSSGVKRERSDSLKRVQNGNEPPIKRERVGRIRVRDDDLEDGEET